MRFLDQYSFAYSGLQRDDHGPVLFTIHALTASAVTTIPPVFSWGALPVARISLSLSALLQFTGIPRLNSK